MLQDPATTPGASRAAPPLPIPLPLPAPLNRPRPATPPRAPAPARLLTALALTLTLPACAPEAGDPADRPADGSAATAADTAVAVTDGAGRTVSLDAPARRVVGMMPSVTEWLIAMGAADRIVARTDFDDHPAVQHLPSVGGGLTPSVEWIAARQPDLVVAWPDSPSRSLVAQLRGLGIAVYAAPSETIEEGLQTARDMGALLGVPAAAAAAVAEVTAGLDSVRSAVSGLDRPDVLFLIGLDPLMAAGPGTFVDQLLDRAGGRNVLEGLDVLWPQLSMEEVVRRAPDVVIVASASVDDPLTALRDRPGWRQVPAVRDGRVHAVAPNLVNRPGPAMDEAAATLARLLHDDVAGLPDPDAPIRPVPAASGPDDPGAP